MKTYEHVYRRRVPTEDYQLIRLDGKSFHSYTKGLQRPYDEKLMEAMDATTLALCEQVPGVRAAYVESDEISLLLTNFRPVEASDSNPSGVAIGEPWMGGVEAKILSLTAAIASVAFNEERRRQVADLPSGEARRQHPSSALFDSRLWTFPGTQEGRELVEKYFLWRRRDSVKNSVTMAALTHFSHRQLHGVNTEAKQERLRAIDAPWEALPAGFRFGRYAQRLLRGEEITFTHGRTGEVKTQFVQRSYWAVEPLEDLDSISTLIPPPPEVTP